MINFIKKILAFIAGLVTGALAMHFITLDSYATNDNYRKAFISMANVFKE